MNINNIRFSASAIASLYQHSLIDISNESDATQHIVEPGTMQIGTSSIDKWKFLGENKKNILVVVEHSDAAHLPDDDLSFLTSMLGACKFGLADVAILNRKNYKEAGYKELLSKFKPRVIFLFGIDPVSFGLPVSFPHFQIQSFASATFLFTPSLEEIKKDELLKSKLWVCLRRIFVI